jgi:hypothetical protein
MGQVKKKGAEAVLAGIKRYGRVLKANHHPLPCIRVVMSVNANMTVKAVTYSTVEYMQYAYHHIFAHH